MSGRWRSVRGRGGRGGAQTPAVAAVGGQVTSTPSITREALRKRRNDDDEAPLVIAEGTSFLFFNFPVNLNVKFYF